MDKNNIISFKERIINVVTENAILYYENLVKYDYLLCSEAFNIKYNTISACEDNFLHLIGINTNLKAKEFFDKAINKTLNENDFDFNKKGQSPKSVKGCVREKIKVLSNLVNFYKFELEAEENFEKNAISCLFAASDGDFTVGIAKYGRPMTLLKNNQLNPDKQKPVELILRKKRKENKYNEIVFGNEQLLIKYNDSINSILN